MNINTITTDDLRHMEGKDGLILQGCGGDLRTFRKQAEMPLISSGRHGKILIEG